jgi:hypothetical protein
MSNDLSPSKSEVYQNGINLRVSDRIVQKKVPQLA